MTRRVGGRVQVNSTISVTLSYQADPVVSSDIFTFRVSTKLFYAAIYNDNLHRIAPYTCTCKFSRHIISRIFSPSIEICTNLVLFKSYNTYTHTHTHSLLGWITKR